MRDSAHLGWPAGQQQNSRFGKRLDGEIYVASEPSATPPRNYALLDRGWPSPPIQRLGQAETGPTFAPAQSGAGFRLTQALDRG